MGGQTSRVQRPDGAPGASADIARNAMIGNVIQVNQLPFWAACFAGIVVTAVFGGAAQRKWCLALLNLAFVGALLGVASLGVVSGIVVAYLALQLVERGRSAQTVLGLTAAAMLALFVLHKLPQATDRLGFTAVGRVLSLIGFSYVAL